VVSGSIFSMEIECVSLSHVLDQCKVGWFYLALACQLCAYMMVASCQSLTIVAMECF